MLRKEKDLTQRQAAADLGISQALLSHYENGIRECNLEFVEKAARYYGVSADYLLGLAEEKEPTDALFRNEDTPDDRALSDKTLLRAIWQLARAGEDAGAAAQQRFLDYFSLALKQYTSGLRLDTSAGQLCALGESVLLGAGGGGGLPPEEASAAAVQTLEAHAEDLLRKLIPPLLK